MKKTIANSISEKIKRGEVTMRSQLSICIEKIKLEGSIVVLLALLIPITGIVFYWINSNSDLLFGGYGLYGFSSFAQSFPYIFIISFIILFILLIYLFRKFDFSYKKSFFLILLLVCIGIISVGWISIKHPIGQKIYQQEGRMLHMGMMNNSNAISGVVRETNRNKIVIQNQNDTIVIVTDVNTHFPFGQPKVGDQIRSVGVWKNAIFTALGVRVFDEADPSTLGPGKMQGHGQGRGRMRIR